MAAKRTMDVAVAAALLVVLAPLLVLCGLAVKLHDGGPVLFAQRRVGQHGRSFTLYKLRSMVPHAEDLLPLLQAANQREGPLFKVSADPRVTPVGRLLRVTSLDEVPQLLNVLKGEMSLIGPRPALPGEAEQFDAELLRRLAVPPGVSGLWQVKGRDDPSFEAYRRFDLEYVDRWSLRLDAQLAVLTVIAVVARPLRLVAGRLGGRRWHERPCEVAVLE